MASPVLDLKPRRRPSALRSATRLLLGSVLFSPLFLLGFVGTDGAITRPGRLLLLVLGAGAVGQLVALLARLFRASRGESLALGFATAVSPAGMFVYMLLVMQLPPAEPPAEPAAEFVPRSPSEPRRRAALPERTRAPHRPAAPALPKLRPQPGFTPADQRACASVFEQARATFPAPGGSDCGDWGDVLRAASSEVCHGFLWAVQGMCHSRRRETDAEVQADRKACSFGIERSCVYLERTGQPDI